MLNSISFLGTTKVRTMTDSHLNTQNTRKLVSQVDREKDPDKILFLNVGDLFKGIYSREIEKASYMKLKDKNPTMQMVFTIGNNDFGFNKDDLDYLINSIKEFSDKGIETVCANIFKLDGQRPEWLKPYTIVERDGDRTFVTGFCTKNINVGKYGLTPKTQTEIVPELIKAIKEEKPDNIIVLNHDFKPTSIEIKKAFEEAGVKIDALYGGHDHSRVEPDYDNSIFYPYAFARSLYEMDLDHQNGKTTLKNIKEISADSIKTSSYFQKDLKEYEEKVGLYNTMATVTLNLTKQYSSPCPLGSFLADGIKEKTNSDIAFFSTGFLMSGIPYQKNKNLTNCDFLRTMAAKTPIQTIELTPDEIKKTFQNGLEHFDDNSSNSRFIQVSNNVKVQGRKNPENNTFEVTQIFIDNEALFDKNGKALNKNKKYTCAVDSYLASGGQNYQTLKEKEKQNVEINDKPLLINELLKELLIQATKKYNKGDEYPSYKIEIIK